ncbi:hypothetical protein KIPB_001999 [Kipferlia bialata]|uniref:4'-phosphopantetheinyl transferase domain-containing protein n=1 Tax=Kipferlia bialata TaxID=797122 RepID=A0A9K3CSX0_9EUKA|nr:hypothetical protein KIPB_001999 [Kipferlia bialata]|eukprot:g1999.t1
MSVYLCYVTAPEDIGPVNARRFNKEMPIHMVRQVLTGRGLASPSHTPSLPNTPPSSITLGHEETGRPCILLDNSMQSAIDISISHSGGTLGVALLVRDNDRPPVSPSLSLHTSLCHCIGVDVVTLALDARDVQGVLGVMPGIGAGVSAYPLPDRGVDQVDTPLVPLGVGWACAEACVKATGNAFQEMPGLVYTDIVPPLVTEGQDYTDSVSSAREHPLVTPSVLRPIPSGVGHCLPSIRYTLPGGAVPVSVGTHTLLDTHTTDSAAIIKTLLSWVCLEPVHTVSVVQGVVPDMGRYSPRHFVDWE